MTNDQGMTKSEAGPSFCHLRLGASLVVLIALALLVSCRRSTTTAVVDPNGPVRVVPPSDGAYTGAYMDFGDTEDDVSLETIEDFDQLVGKHQAIIASSSYW